MKTIVLVALLCAGSSAGCVTWPHESRAPNAAVNMPIAAPLPPGPITADQVEPANAHRVAEAVWDEMDRDQQKDLLPPAAKDAKKR